MKLKFSSLKHDNGRRYWMLSLLTKQRDVHFAFVPSLWREFYFDKDGRQFLDNDIRYNNSAEKDAMSLALHMNWRKPFKILY